MVSSLRITAVMTTLNGLPAALGPKKGSPLALVNVGTNGGSAYTRPGSVPSRSDTVLVSSYAYDAAGRTKDVTDPRGLVNRTFYDALGRTTKTIANYVDGSTSLIRYGFDAMGHRDKEGTTNIYFTSGWQEIENRNSSGQVTTQYVYSPGYIDAMLERDRDSNADGTTDERLYVLQDVNFNVTEIATTSGTVAERFQYDAYGKRTIFTSAWASTTEAYGFLQGHQGGKVDPTTGHIHFRNRELNTNQMRWLQEDPMGYIDSSSLYATYGFNPLVNGDAIGLSILNQDKMGKHDAKFGELIREALQAIVNDAATITYDKKTGQFGYDPNSIKKSKCDTCWALLKKALDDNQKAIVVYPTDGQNGSSPALEGKDPKDPKTPWTVGINPKGKEKVYEWDPKKKELVRNPMPFPIAVWHEIMGHAYPGNTDHAIDPRNSKDNWEPGYADPIVKIENIARKCMRDSKKWDGILDRGPYN